MSNFISLREVRTLITDVLRVANDLDEGGPPELHPDLQRIRHCLHSALKSIDRATAPDPLWPGPVARA